MVAPCWLRPAGLDLILLIRCIADGGSSFLSNCVIFVEWRHFCQSGGIAGVYRIRLDIFVELLRGLEMRKRCKIGGLQSWHGICNKNGESGNYA
jgi:hypothetical protein